MMTFSSFPPQAAFTALISSRTLSYSLSFTQPMLMTMSISEAPFFTASSVSKHLVAVVLYPLGKPITVQMAIFPSTYSAALRT